MARVKVVTINILNDLSLWEDRKNLLVKGLAALEPDLIALQEANVPTKNAFWLSEQLGMPFVYFSPKTGEAGKTEGEAILSRLPFDHQETLDLKTQARVAQCVRIQVDGQPLAFANGHFYWQPGESEPRLKQVDLLLDWLQTIPGDLPLVVCGDFNGTPETSAIRRLREQFTSAYAARHGHEPAYTTPTPLPRSRLALLHMLFSFIREIRFKEINFNWRGTLDYIFVNPHARIIDCQVVLDQPDRANLKIYPSDHFGLEATLEIGSNDE